MDRKQIYHIRKLQDDANLAVDLTQFPKYYPEIAYDTLAEEQKLDIILPGTDGIYPVVLLVHGGGWAWGGRREECLSSVYKIISQGYALCAMDFRLVPEHSWPDHIVDVQTVIRFLKLHGSEYQLDTSKLVIWGNSSGAHLSNLAAAMSGKQPWVGEHNLYQEADNRLDGVISWYGVSCFNDEMNANGGTPLFRHSEEVSQKMFDDASPLLHIDQTYPKTLIQHGTGDTTIPYAQSVRLHEKVQEICGPDRSTLELFPNAGHADPVFKHDDNINRVIDWLDELYFPQGRPAPRTPLPEIKLTVHYGMRIDPYEQQP